MSFSFRPAVRENVGLLIALAGGTGSGKTYSAMRLASGIAGGKPFCVIDTEAGRAKHYADQFKFDHGDLKPPFRPNAYAEAIKAADEAGYPVIVVDSASHEHAGEGGILDMHEAELDRLAGDDWKKREAVKMVAWVKPKTEHKQMVQRLLQIRAHIILCFRAEEKIEMVRDEKGKMQIVPKKTQTGLDGWVPICEKSLPFEATCSFLLLSSAPGFPRPIKLQEQHRAIFPLNEPINEQAGQRLAAWATGKVKNPVPPQSPAGASVLPQTPSTAVGADSKTAAGQESSAVGENLQTSRPTDGRPASVSAPASAAAPHIARIKTALSIAGIMITSRFNAMLAKNGWKSVDEVPAEEAESALTFISREVDKQNARAAKATT
jgi:hypothetical protein